MLLMSLKASQPQGGDLRLAGLQPQIAEIFRKSRFDTLFKIYENATRRCGIRQMQLLCFVDFSKVHHF